MFPSFLFFLIHDTYTAFSTSTRYIHDFFHENTRYTKNIVHVDTLLTLLTLNILEIIPFPGIHWGAFDPSGYGLIIRVTGWRCRFCYLF